MRRFKSAGQAQRFLSLHGLVQNLFRVGRHLLSSPNLAITILRGLASRDSRLRTLDNNRASRSLKRSLPTQLDSAQASKVSGVTIVATSARSFLPIPLALAANRRRWSSLSRTRRPPSCSRRTRFSSRS
jgi:hypothetical protein